VNIQGTVSKDLLKKCVELCFCYFIFSFPVTSATSRGYCANKLPHTQRLVCLAIREPGAAAQGNPGCSHGSGMALPHRIGDSPTEPEQSQGGDSARTWEPLHKVRWGQVQGQSGTSSQQDVVVGDRATYLMAQALFKPLRLGAGSTCWEALGEAGQGCGGLLVPSGP